MKKIITYIFIVILITPNFVFASWWNPFMWKIWGALISPDKSTIQSNIPKPEIEIKATSTTRNSSGNNELELQKLKDEIELLKAQQKEKVKPKIIEKPAIIEKIVTPPPTPIQPQVNQSDIICKDIKKEAGDFTTKRWEMESLLTSLLENYSDADNKINTSSQMDSKEQSIYAYNVLFAKKETIYSQTDNIKEKVGMLVFPKADQQALEDFKKIYIEISNITRESFDLKLQGWQTWKDTPSYYEIGYNAVNSYIKAGESLIVQGSEKFIQSKDLFDKLPTRQDIITTSYRKLLVGNSCSI